MSQVSDHQRASVRQRRKASRQPRRIAPAGRHPCALSPANRARGAVLSAAPTSTARPAELAALAARPYRSPSIARASTRMQADIYRRFGLSFDHFSRTSGAANRLLTQELFRQPRCRRSHRAAHDQRRPIRRPTSASCPTAMWSAPALIAATPNARATSAKAARACSTRTISSSPRSAISGATDVEFRETRHLFLKLSAIRGPRCARWMRDATRLAAAGALDRA